MFNVRDPTIKFPNFHDASVRSTIQTSWYFFLNLIVISYVLVSQLSLCQSTAASYLVMFIIILECFCVP